MPNPPTSAQDQDDQLPEMPQTETDNTSAANNGSGEGGDEDASGPVTDGTGEGVEGMIGLESNEEQNDNMEE